MKVEHSAKKQKSAQKQQPTHKASTPVAAPAPACISQPITSGSHKRTSPRQESAKKPGQQQLQETAAAADNVRPGSELVGRRVKVFWSADNAWFQGSLSEFSGSSGKHLCEYDDGDQEWLELSNERYELVEQSGETSQALGELAVHTLPLPTRLDVFMAAWLPHAQNEGKMQFHGRNKEQEIWKCSIAWGCAGPPPRRLNFGGRRQAAKKQRLVLDDSDEEDADMADAASEEVSGSEFEAADASSSSEDEDDSTAVEASNEVSWAWQAMPLVSMCCGAAVSAAYSYFWHREAHVQTPSAMAPSFCNSVARLAWAAGACRDFVTLLQMDSKRTASQVFWL